MTRGNPTCSTNEFKLNLESRITGALEQQQEFVRRLANDDMDGFPIIESAITSLMDASKTPMLNNQQQVFVNLALAKAHLCKGGR